MTIFSQPKGSGPVKPEPCTRCRARMGTSWLDYMVRGDAESKQAAPRREWLCAACRDIVQRGAEQN